jgi:hypothetical protein
VPRSKELGLNEKAQIRQAHVIGRSHSGPALRSNM